MPKVLDVLTIGESLGCLRTAVPLQPGAALQSSIAGAESNVAIGVARLGHSVRWAGVVGDDAFGALVVRVLLSEGIDISARQSTSQTGIVLFTERLPNVTTVDYFRHKSAGSSLDEADVNDAFKGLTPKILHLTGITPALSPSARAAVHHAIALAKRKGSRICLDINFRSRLWTREEARGTLAPLAQQCDILIASEDELDLALSAPPIDLNAQVAELLDSASEVIVKRGPGGASGFTRESELHQPSFNVGVVDTIGAGDAFVAGYLSATIDGADLRARLERGTALGAFAVANHGDWEGSPRRVDLDLLALSAGDAVR